MMALKPLSKDYKEHKVNRNPVRGLSKSLLVFLLIPALPAFSTESQDLEFLKYFEQSKETAQMFMQTLGNTLKKQLELGGAESAIGVCKQIAPALADEYSIDGRIVKRVSLKTRNIAQGAPDEWESKVLKDFDNQQSSKAVSEMNVAQITSDSDGRWFRYMKAIPTQPMCLQCHGQPADISASVRQLLLQEYPQDEAVGYSAGQVRGAISIKYRLGVNQQ